MPPTTLPEPLLLDQTDGKTVLDVLILDDLEADRVRLRRLCRKAGLEFRLHEAEDLAGFASILDRVDLDLVFLDYQLAMDTGLDALRLLRAHEDQVAAIPIMVTSVDRYDVAVEAMRSGCADYITKEGLSVEAIRKSVVSAFERRMLVTTLNQAQSAQKALRASVLRLAAACGPEIRSVLASTLRHARALRGTETLDATVRDTLSTLEKSCIDIFEFVEEVKGVLDRTEPVAAAMAPTASARPRARVPAE